VSSIEELKDVIRKLHGVESTHVESVPVKETFKGKIVWEGIVEVFELHGHPKASRVYAWGYETENAERPSGTLPCCTFIRSLRQSKRGVLPWYRR
jgi:hypothetical protein